MRARATTPPTERQIRQQHLSGLSIREIARRQGLSRSVITRVIQGKVYRPDVTKNHKDVLARCRICGGLVVMPCRACALRSNK